MANTTASTCSDCGTPAIPSGPNARRLITVVDELGTSAMCDLHVIGLLSRLARAGDVTVFVARPTALST
jgi:hypothetical protein